MALKQTVGFFSSPVTRVSVICEAAVESNPELLKWTKVTFKLKWFVITGEYSVKEFLFSPFFPSFVNNPLLKQ